MRKCRILLLSIFLFLPIFVFADDCADFLSEGKQHYNNGNYQKAKECFAYVKSECGSYYGDVTSWINKCDVALTPTLSVSKSQISCSASGTTQYVTVTSNTTWEVQHPTGNMYSVTRSGNTLTVKITANTSTSSREDYFIVRTSDGVINKKITLKQSGKTSSNSSYSSGSSYLTPKGKIHKVWVEHNVMYGGQECMKIHVKFEVDNMKGKIGDCVAWFYYDNGNKLYDTNNSYSTTNGQVAVSETFTATYDGSIWNDFVLYIPNSELHLVRTGSYKFCVGIFDHNDKLLATSNYVTFTYGN